MSAITVALTGPSSMVSCGPPARLLSITEAAYRLSILQQDQLRHCTPNAMAKTLKGPNDIVFDAQGGFYFTDLGKRRERSMDRGSVFYALPDGSMIKEIVHPIENPKRHRTLTG